MCAVQVKFRPCRSFRAMNAQYKSSKVNVPGYHLSFKLHRSVDRLLLLIHMSKVPQPPFRPQFGVEKVDDGGKEGGDGWVWSWVGE